MLIEDRELENILTYDNAKILILGYDMHSAERMSLDIMSKLTVKGYKLEIIEPRRKFRIKEKNTIFKLHSYQLIQNYGDLVSYNPDYVLLNYRVRDEISKARALEDLIDRSAENQLKLRYGDMGYEYTRQPSI